jgi:PilX N-terminal
MALKRRSSERGAALFVVVLVVTLLTAIGAFAMHATSLAQLSSGYSRRAAAALYLAEMAANLRVATIADDGADFYAKGHHYPPYASVLADDCKEAKELKSLLPVDTAAFCAVMDTSAAMTKALAASSGLSGDADGFFGTMSRPDSPLVQSVVGGIRVEATDEVRAPIALEGNPLDGKVKQVTLTITGALLPYSTGGDACKSPITQASETQRLRGFVTYVNQ